MNLLRHFSWIFLGLLVTPFSLPAEEYDPNPDEFMNAFFTELEGAIGGKEGAALHAGIGFLKASSPVSYQKEAIMGETIALQSFAKFGRLVNDRQLLEYISVVGNSITRVSPRPQTPYYFAVCQQQDPNAFAAPGGYIFLTTGLLKLLRNEDELAGVLGHEIAHIARQDAIRSIKLSKQVSALSEGLGVFLGPKSGTTPAKANSRPDYFTMVSDLTQTIAEKGYPLSQETKADEFGTDFVYRAGYQPQGLKNFLRRLSQVETDEPGVDSQKTAMVTDPASLKNLSNHWIGSHRDHAKRVTTLDKWIQKHDYPAVAIPQTRAARFKANVIDRLK
jgi:predicted Zn-dependent protease